MARIQPLTLATAPAGSRPLLEAVTKKLGRTPNLFLTLAHSPAALQSYLQQSEALSHGLFSAAERERIALAVAEANGCDYCLAAHTALGKGAGLDPAEVQAARRGASSDPKQAALARFARTLAAERGVVSDAGLEAFLAAGWSRAQAVEAVAVVGINLLTNYVNHLAATEVDFPQAPVLQPA
jgi:uncharacterized peroxidase-related enzyme